MSNDRRTSSSQFFNPTTPLAFVSKTDGNLITLAQYVALGSFSVCALFPFFILFAEILVPDFVLGRHGLNDSGLRVILRAEAGSHVNHISHFQVSIVTAYYSGTLRLVMNNQLSCFRLSALSFSGLSTLNLSTVRMFS